MIVSFYIYGAGVSVGGNGVSVGGKTAVGVSIGTKAGVGVAVSVGGASSVGVAVIVAVTVIIGVGVMVNVGVGVSVAVGDGVGVGVGNSNITCRRYSKRTGSSSGVCGLSGPTMVIKKVIGPSAFVCVLSHKAKRPFSTAPARNSCTNHRDHD